MSAEGRYRILRTRKTGGMAEILEAQVVGERGFERRVAVKRLLPEYAEDPGLVRGFIDEARILSRLHHAGIVSVFDFGQLEGRPFQVLELVNGLDLGEILARKPGGRLEPELALQVVLDVAHALAHAHSARTEDGEPLGVVHRDVSPDNILISWTGDVKLADFGIALAAERLEHTRVGVAKGKLAYMAPEQYAGVDIGPAADIFALGCVLHTALTGKSPLESEVARHGLLSGQAPTLDARLPLELRSIIQRATRVEPHARHPNAKELAREVHQALLVRLKQDARSALSELVQRLAPELRQEAEAPRRGRGLIDELMDAGALLSQPKSEVAEAPTALSSSPAVTLSPAGESGTDPLLGTMVHGYRLEAVIGRGSMARVYRATHAVLGRQCAVKVLLGGGTYEERAVKRLQREARTMAALEHENLVRVLDYGTATNGAPFLCMELVEGETLRERLRLDGPMPPARAAAITREIALGLACAHQAGLVHRDLKPSNIMLVPEAGAERVKILDFGIARVPLAPDSTRLTTGDVLLGTPRFMAPEQIMDASSVGPPADLYALGGVLYAMLAGDPPFRGPTAEVIHAHLQEEPAPLPPSAGLERLAAKLLAKEPAERPTAAEVLAFIDALPLALDHGKTRLVPQGDDDTLLPTRTTEPEAALPDTRTTLPPGLFRPTELSATAVAWTGPRGAQLAALGLVVVLATALVTAWVLRKPDPAPVVLPPDPPAAAPPTALAPPTASPQAHAAAEVEPREAQPLVTEPARRPRSEPADAVRPSPQRTPGVEQLRLELARRIQARGLSQGDLRLLAGAPPLLQALEAPGRSRADEERALQKLTDLVASAVIDERLLEEKLARIQAKLKRAASELGPERYTPLEDRYLELRPQVRVGGGEIPGRLTALERELDRALAGR